MNIPPFWPALFRSIRFGASSAHGKANLIFFNYFKEKGAFSVSDSGKYAVNFDAMKEAIDSLSNLIITIQGDGDYEKAAALISQYGIMDETLESCIEESGRKGYPCGYSF